MTDSPYHELDGSQTDDDGVSRRAYLATAGVLGTGFLDGSLSESETFGQRSTGTLSLESGSATDRDDFLWLGGSMWRDDAIRENLYAFARRHDLAVVLVKRRSPDESLADTLGPPLEQASEFRLDVWLNVGLLRDLRASAFVSDEQARESHLDWLRSVATFHGRFFDAGRFVVWQEAPVMGFWSESGAWNGAAVDALLAHGPEIFAAQQRAIRAANDALDVGPFVHFPYIVDSKQAEVFRKLAADLLEGGANPDFGFVDFYRGWYEKDVGPVPANDAVRSLITNARAGLDDQPVYYLGQSHTINPRHTPSKQAIRMNLRTSIDAGAAGLGWYARNRYVPTKGGFDPFVPNVEGAKIDGDAVNTVTFARDRFRYAWLATLARSAGFDAENAFDLWLVGDDFGFHDHRLSLRTDAGKWAYVGDIGGYVEGDFPDRSAVTHSGTAVRALDRDRFLGDGGLDCRIETASATSRSTLRAAFAMPCDPNNYVTEQQVAAFARGDTDLTRFALGHARGSVMLEPGEVRALTIPTDGTGGTSLRALCHPEYVDALDRLASFEADENVEPAARFDLWVQGSEVDRSSAVPSLVARDGTTKSARGPAAVTTASESLALYHGLERERFLGDSGLRLAPGVPSAIDACYAMPYAGTATFRSPDEAAALLAEQPSEVQTFCLGYVTND